MIDGGPSFDIGAVRIGGGAPCFVIAEAGVNHNGDLARARRLVDLAAEAGADAVKFQTFVPEALATAWAPKAEYQLRGTPTAESQLDMLRRLALDDVAHRALASHAAARGILFLSTPFDEASARFLDTLGVPIFKVPSGELTNLPLLSVVGGFRKPVIVSTGMATLPEIDEALATLTDAGTPSIALLHCVSNYPADAADVNLRAMDTLRDAYHLPVGYSDHTLGLEVAFAAVARGAAVVEKHFTLDRGDDGPDHAASATPEELASLVAGIRRIERAMGDGRKIPAAAERQTADVARRSLVAACDIPPGSRITADLVTTRRPGTGLPPSRIGSVLGREARVAIAKGTLLTLEQLS